MIRIIREDGRLRISYSADGDNCGDGSGGFRPGNRCAKHKGGAGGGAGKAGSAVATAARPRPAVAAAGKSGTKERLAKALGDVRGQKASKEASASRASVTAPMPPDARVTPEDVKAAASTPAIEHPKSDEDVARFVSQAQETPAYKAVDAKLKAIAADSPGGNPTLWSLGKHATGDIEGTLKTHKHEAYDHIQWTPGRKAIHEEILNGMLNPEAKTKPGEKPKVVFLMGPPGSGKTVAGQPEAMKINKHFTTVNADDIKGKLPEYEGWNAGAVHEESALLAEGPLTQRAQAARHHILMDLTGGNTAKMEQMAEAMHKDGYEVHVVSIALPAYKSTGRAWDRFTRNAFGHADPTGKTQELGRFVPPAYVHAGIDGKPEKTYQTLKSKPFVKSYVSISTDVGKGEPPRVVDRGTN